MSGARRFRFSLPAGESQQAGRGKASLLRLFLLRAGSDIHPHGVLFRAPNVTGTTDTCRVSALVAAAIFLRVPTMHRSFCLLLAVVATSGFVQGRQVEKGIHVPPSRYLNLNSKLNFKLRSVDYSLYISTTIYIYLYLYRERDK